MDPNPHHLNLIYYGEVIIGGFRVIESTVIVNNGKVCLFIGGCKLGGRYLGISCILISNSLYNIFHHIIY